MLKLKLIETINVYENERLQLKKNIKSFLKLQL